MRNINLSAFTKAELALFADVIADCVDRVVPNKDDAEYDDYGALVKSFFTCDLMIRTTLARKTLNRWQRDALELLWQSYAKECVFYNYLYLGEVSKRFEVWHARSKFAHLPVDASDIKEHICSMRKQRLTMFAKLLREAAE